MNTAEVLRTARESLPGHWYQGDFNDGTGNYCALGHIGRALGQENGDIDEIWGNADARNAADALNAVIQEQYPEYGGEHSMSVANWNDEEGRIEAEVIAVFEKAIVKAEESI